MSLLLLSFSDEALEAKPAEWQHQGLDTCPRVRALDHHALPRLFEAHGLLKLAEYDLADTAVGF